MLFALLVAAGSRLFLLMTPAGARESVLYQAGTLAPNYFQFGAVRRGLGGSIAYLLSTDALTATLAFHTLFVVVVAGLAVWLLQQREASFATRVAMASVALALMLRWGDDAGRTDLAIVAVLGGATLAHTKRRPSLAALLVGAGLFIHESSFIYGVPLLIALFARPEEGSVARRQYLAAAGILVGALLLYIALDSLPHAGRREIVQTVRGRLPIHEHVEWALYFALSGMRGVVASVCQNRIDPTYWLHVASGLVLIALTGAAVLGLPPGRHWRRALIASIPGFVFLSLVANDMSRWAFFACFNVWLVGAAGGPGVEEAPSARGLAWVRVAIAFALLPLISFKPGRIEFRIYAPSPAIEAVARRLGGPRTPSVEEALERCDPHWSDVLNRP